MASHPYNVKVTRWVKLMDFNPGSFKQKLALFKAFGHKAKVDRKTKSASSGEETLKSLIAAHCDSKKESDQKAVECYRAIRETQALTKVLGTYVKGWRPGADGRIHATPGIWGDMFRISWRKPNLAATVSDKKEIQIASGFRKCIRCADDEIIIESDWKGMEALIVGELAGDEVYKRLARLGVHDYMGLHMIRQPIGLESTDDELKAKFKWFKATYPKLRDDAKHTVHGKNYGMTEFLMAELYEMSRKRAKELLDLYDRLFPKIKAWQQATILKAHTDTRLVNPWGYRMPFWDVYRWNQKRFNKLREMWVKYLTQGLPSRKDDLKWIERIVAEGGGQPAIERLSYGLGEEAKSAISFLPRDIGAAMLKDALLRLESDYQLVSRGIIRCCIHDSILAICKRSEAPEVAQQVKDAMSAPVAQLNGLVIEVEQSAGMTWDKSAMEEWKC